MKKMVLLLSSIILLGACNEVGNSTESSNSEQSSTEVTESVTDEDIKNYKDTVADFTKITVPEITEKINNGDAFYLFAGKDTCPYCHEFSPKLREATSIFEESSTNSIVESKIYYLDLTNASNQETLDFASKYNIDTVPAFQYFEGQIYHSEIENIDSKNITVDEIKEFMNSPYDDKDVTTAPDTTMENDNEE